MIQIDDNDSPITVAGKLVWGTKSVEMTPVRKAGIIIATGKVPEDGNTCEDDMFSVEELKEIAEYLMIFCKYHGEDT